MGPMKTIFVGHSKTTLHKEELGVSDKEKQLRQSITDNASSQRRKSSAQKGGSEVSFFATEVGSLLFSYLYSQRKFLCYWNGFHSL